jgi:predicted nucleic acid-binding Zn ribbon protein
MFVPPSETNYRSENEQELLEKERRQHRLMHLASLQNKERIL